MSYYLFTSYLPLDNRLLDKESICQALNCTLTANYIEQKHNVSLARIERVNLHSLGSYLKALPIHTCASTVKLIHGWSPTYATLCHQGWQHLAICPCCQTTVDSTHLLKCPATSTIKSHELALQFPLLHNYHTHSYTYYLSL
jgi:hypothetical protein